MPPLPALILSVDDSDSKQTSSAEEAMPTTPPQQHQLSLSLASRSIFLVVKKKYMLNHDG
jgi:hypothetical protein